MNIRKFLTSIIALAMFSNIPCIMEISPIINYNVSAEVLTEGSLGGNVTYSFDAETETLTISGTGDMQNFSRKESPFYKNKSDNNIRNIVVEDGVTSIGDCVFTNLRSVENVTLPDSITSIGELSFNACTSLTSIDIPKSVTNISEMAFFWCKSLKSVDIPEGITTIESSTFTTCIELEEVNIPDTVTSLGYGVFRNCPKLQSVIIPSSVTSIGRHALGYINDDNGDPEKKSDFTIYGDIGSAAEKYAMENDINFIAIDENNPPDTYEQISSKDILSLKKYLLNINSNFENVQDMDYNSDNKVNILDLIIAKNTIIYG